MDTTTYPHVVSSRKRTRADISSNSDDEYHETIDDEQTQQKSSSDNWSRFIVLEAPHPTTPLSKLSPFVVAKGIQRKFGTVIIKTFSSWQTKTLCRSCLTRVSRMFFRFILKKDGESIKTNTLFVTFNTHTPPKELKIGNYILKVQMYIPNPLRCFNCQKFGHSKKFCKNRLACWKCGGEPHDWSECTSETTHCLNCKGDHCASSKSCPI